MANKVNPTKETKKTRRRLKRTVRKTLGALFLVTALVIGAIPVEGLQAAGEDGIAPVADRIGESITPETNIPKIPDDAKVYRTEDKVFHFVYIPHGGSYIAIIVGYDSARLPQGNLVIPNKVNAYRQYSANAGQDSDYAAVGASGNFLFYRERKTERITKDDYDANKDNYPLDQFPDYWKEEGTVTLPDPNDQNSTIQYIDLSHEVGEYKVCYLEGSEGLDKWIEYADSLYYDKEHSSGEAPADSLSAPATGLAYEKSPFQKVGSQQSFMRITDVIVDYISNQYYDGSKWTEVGEGHPENGIFAGQGNIVNLSLGVDLKGVGNFAFYGCTNLDSVSFQNGLNVIGTGAFNACANLKTVSLPVETNLNAIGAKAFLNCTQLTSFTLPTNVTTIGDSAFEGCERLRSIDLCAEGSNEQGSVTSRLNALGQDVFKNCKALESITFPDQCNATVPISCFEGCTSLAFICARNMNMSFPEDGTYYTYEMFKNMLGADTDFYFEGIENSALHEMCKKNCFAFSYIGDSTQGFAKRNRYEITMLDEEDNVGTSTYVVNSDNVLIDYNDADVKKITIPAKIGPYGIETIGNGVFQNFCNLEVVTVLDTVKNIESDAFKGCHKLGFVNFSSEDINIASGAFDTQTFSGTHRCGGTKVDDDPEGEGTPACKLHFVGPISPTSGSYQYAMGSTGKYNNSSQQTSYIIYCSGLPQNLEVVYNPDKGLSELVEFPSLQYLSSKIKYTPSNYAYIDEEYVKAAEEAVRKFTTPGEALTEYEAAIIDSALNIVIPDGVEAVDPGLFLKKDRSNNVDMTVTAYSLREIESGELDENGKIKEGTGTFAGCEHLTGVSLLEGSEGKETSIEDYAFRDCVKLKDVTMSPKVTSMGIAPFLGCEDMRDINFQNSNHFACENSIIYGLDTEGNKAVLIECLQGRTLKEVPETELAGVTALQKEAFRGAGVRAVNLRGTSITEIPEGAFAETESLTTVYLPATLRMIMNYAFSDSEVDTFYVYGANTNNQPYAFYNEAGKSPYGDSVGMKCPADGVTWYSTPDSASYDTGYYAQFVTQDLPVPTEYIVNFEYYNIEGEYVYQNSVQTITNEFEVVYPEDVAEEVTDEDGILKFFDGWDRRVNEETNTWTYVAKYRTITWTVTVMDSADRGSAVLGTLTVVNGFSAMNPLDALLKEKVPEDVYKTFSGWSCSGNLDAVTEDLIATATYAVAGEYVIRYYAMVNSYGSYELYNSITVKEGENAPDIAPPRGTQYEISGYTFSEWENLPTNVTANWSVYAAYKPGSGSNPGEDNPGGTIGQGYKVQYYAMVNSYGNYELYNTITVAAGEDAPDIAAPKGTQYEISGYVFSEWGNLPKDVRMDSIIYAIYKPTNGGSGDTPGTGTRYNLTVQDGSGSGSYLPGTQIIVRANTPARGQTFSSWTVSPAETVVTDKTLSSIIVTMPDHDVALIANYKASASNSSGGNTNNPSGSGNGNTPSSGTISSGTTVVIDKNGLSNTGVVSATVNGSSDNFTIKVTENSSATEAVLKALQADYGNLDNVKYFPMDISLYDSTGTRKITDTRGLSISITLPLPDSLIPYAGNNKVAGVVNDKLDKLTPKFTTINGVSCVTFTAEHFSPYVIYVDVTNLSDGTTVDSTPKTADGIHPKWFLVMGFASLSFVMFMMKDGGTKDKKKQKVAVRA